MGKLSGYWERNPADQEQDLKLNLVYIFFSQCLCYSPTPLVFYDPELVAPPSPYPEAIVYTATKP